MAHVGASDQNLMEEFRILLHFIVIHSKLEFSLYSVVFTDAIFQHLQY